MLQSGVDESFSEEADDWATPASLLVPDSIARCLDGFPYCEDETVMLRVVPTTARRSRV